MDQSAISITLLTLAGFSVALEAPVITEHPVDMTVSRNEPVTLSCKAKGRPRPDINWFKDGSRVIMAPEDPDSHRILLPDGSLFFLTAKQSKKDSDAGVYWCLASNSLGQSRSKNATLEIAYLRDDFRVEPDDVSVLLGGRAVFHCEPPKGHPRPDQTWKKDGKVIQEINNKIYITTEGSLIIEDVVKADEGQYQCSASNVAFTKESRMATLKVSEPPAFLNRPQDQDVLAGSDVLLVCQVSGDPHPEVVWSRVPEMENSKKFVVIPGKGLRIERVHPSDEGTYTCKAFNVLGTISASAHVTVSERPVITVKPMAFIQQRAGNPITLECMVTGKPNPSVFWSLEGNSKSQEMLIMPGSRVNNMYVTSDGALKIENPSINNSGHYVCSALNPVGAAVARSQVVVVGGHESNQKQGESAVNQPYLEETRVAMLETVFASTSLSALSPTSIRVAWQLSPSAPGNMFVDGFRLFYRQRRTDRYETFLSVTIPSEATSSFTIHRLKPFVEYEAFVQPFHGPIVGQTSRLLRIWTPAELPDVAPEVVMADAVNGSLIRVKWIGLDQDQTNGPLIGYEVSVSSNEIIVGNMTVGPDRTEAFVFVHEYDDYDEETGEYTITVKALNKAGLGPPSYPPYPVPKADLTKDYYSNSLIGYTWLLAFLGLGSILGMILWAMIHFHKRKRSGNGLFFSESSQISDLKADLAGSARPAFESPPKPVWADPRGPSNRFWGNLYDEKKDSSSDRNLLGHLTNEYACIMEQDHPLTFGHFGMNSPEPYATTDLIRRQQKRTNGIYGPTHQRYHYPDKLLPLSVTPMLLQRSQVDRQSSKTSARIYKENKNWIQSQRDSRSCDNLNERSSFIAESCAYAKVSLDRVHDEPLPLDQNVFFYQEGQRLPEPPPYPNHLAMKANKTFKISSPKCYRIKPVNPASSSFANPTPLRLTSTFAESVPFLNENCSNVVVDDSDPDLSNRSTSSGSSSLPSGNAGRSYEKENLPKL